MVKLTSSLKLFSMLMFCILFINMASAVLETKSFDPNAQNFGEVQIHEWLGISNKADYRLMDYGASVIDVWAEGEYKLYKKTHLFTGVFYKDKIGNRGDLNDVKFFIWQNKQVTKYTPIYENKNCHFEVNGTEFCDQVLISNESYVEDQSGWIPYEKGMELNESEGKWRMEAKRKPNKPIDFILEAHGKTFDEWAWWDNDWDFKKPINISTAQSTWNNYTVLLNIAYDGDMQTDFDDLRFTDGSETVELGYWLNNKTDSTSAYVWVNTSLTQNQNTTIYMYYGNAGASSNSNRENVFTLKTNYGAVADANIETQAGKVGVEVQPTANVIIAGFKKNSGSTDTIGYILDSGKSVLTSVSYSGIWANFTNPYPMTSGTKYFFASDKGGSSRTFRGDTSSPPLCTTSAFLTSVGGLNWNGGILEDCTNWWHEFEEAWLSLDASPTIYFGAEESANSFEVNSISPIDDYNSTTQSINFEGNATDETGVYSLNLTINGTVYETVTGVGNTNLTSSSTENLADGYWEWYYTANDDLETKNSTTRSLLIDSTSPVISTAYNLTDLITLTLPINSTWHFNATDTHLDTCWYNSTDHAQTIVTCNSTINTTWATEGTKEIYFCANDTFGLETCNNTSIDIYHITYNQANNPETIAEGFNATFNLTVNMTSIPTSSAYLVLNNTVYPATTSNASTNSYYFERTVQIPDGWGNTTGILQNWYWNYTIDGVITNQSTSTDNITVYELAVDDCSSYGDVILNFSLNDEETNTMVNGSAGANVEIDLTLTSKTNSSIALTYSNTWTNESNPKVCLPNNVLNNSQYWLDLVLGFSSTDHVWEFYYIDDGTLNSTKIIQGFDGTTTSNISLMDLLTADSTSFLFNYFDQDGLAVDEAVVHVMRKYIGSGQFLEVERAKADENGDTIVHLVEEDVIYFFYITQYGELLYTSSTYTALCQATPCTIQISASGGSASFPTDWDLIDGGAYNIEDDAGSRLVNMTYSLNDTSTMNLTIFKYNSDGSYSPIVSNTSTGTSGSILLTVPQSAGNVSFFASVYQDDDFKRSEWVDFEEKAQDRFGVTLALFIGALIILSLGLMAITEGVGTLVFVILGVALSGFLGLVTTSLSTGVNIVVYLVVAGGILLWKLTGGRR